MLSDRASDRATPDLHPFTKRKRSCRLSCSLTWSRSTLFSTTTLDARCPSEVELGFNSSSWLHQPVKMLVHALRLLLPMSPFHAGGCLHSKLDSPFSFLNPKRRIQHSELSGLWGEHRMWLDCSRSHSRNDCSLKIPGGAGVVLVVGWNGFGEFDSGVGFSLLIFFFAWGFVWVACAFWIFGSWV